MSHFEVTEIRTSTYPNHISSHNSSHKKWIFFSVSLIPWRMLQTSRQFVLCNYFVLTTGWLLTEAKWPIPLSFSSWNFNLNSTTLCLLFGLRSLEHGAWLLSCCSKASPQMERRNLCPFHEHRDGRPWNSKRENF